MRLALRLIAGLIVMMVVGGVLAVFQLPLLSLTKTASGLPCRAARLALPVLHVAAPFVGLLAGLLVFAYPTLKRLRLLRPLAGVLLVGLLVGLGIAAWKLRPARLVAETPKLATELAGLIVERNKTEPLDLSLRGRPGEIIRAVITINLRGLTISRCGDQLTMRFHSATEMEQTVRSVEANGRLHLTQRWPRVTREIWLGERRIPDTDLGGPGKGIDLRDLTLEATQEPNGSIRVYKVLGPQGEAAHQYIKNLEKATVGHVVMTPGRPVRIGDSWPGGKRDFSIPGGGLLTYMQDAHLAGVAHWRGKEVAVIDLIIGQPLIRPDEERKEKPVVTRFTASGRALLALETGQLVAQSSTISFASTDRIDGEPVEFQFCGSVIFEPLP